MDLAELIEKWENSALNFKEAETLINLLIVDIRRLEKERLYESIKAPIEVISELKTILDSAKMKAACFGFDHEEVVTTPHLSAEIRQHPTDYIKEATRLYRHSWIIDPLERVIRHLGGKSK